MSRNDAFAVRLPDGQPLQLAIVGAAGLLTAWLFLILFAQYVHVPPSAAPAGVAGYVVLHHYSKSQEIAIYATGIASTILFVAAALFEWRWFAETISVATEAPSGARWYAAATFVVPLFVFAFNLPGAALFNTPFGFIEAVAGLALVQMIVAFWLKRVV